jgi:hypothetical protein
LTIPPSTTAKASIAVAEIAHATNVSVTSYS